VRLAQEYIRGTRANGIKNSGIPLFPYKGDNPTPS
jgi:hypothetical protein